MISEIPLKSGFFDFIHHPLTEFIRFHDLRGQSPISRKLIREFHKWFSVLLPR